MERGRDSDKSSSSRKEKKLNSELAELREKLDNTKRALEDANRAKAKFEGQLKSANTLLAEREEGMNGLEGAKRAKENEIRDLNERIATLEAKVQGCQRAQRVVLSCPSCAGFQRAAPAPGSADRPR